MLQLQAFFGGVRKNMNNSHHEKKGGNFFNGFFWGAVLGGGFAYLLSTKRGRDLLKDLISDGVDMLDGLTQEPEIAEEEQYAATEEPFIVEEQDDAGAPAVEAKQHAQRETSSPLVKKRFFKASKK